MAHRTHLKQKLYKIDTKGKTRVWWMEYDNEKYRTHSGIDGGKIVISGWVYPTGKNVGRANESSVEEQVLSEVNAEYVKKQAQGKYHALLWDAKFGANFHECMLADKYNPKKHTDFPYYSQPKLDGIRALVSKDGIQSRNGKPIVSCPHILEALDDFFKEHPDVVLDGELYNHEMKDKFEELVSLVRKQKPTMKDFIATAVSVQYHIYDAIMDCTFEDRSNFIWNNLDDELPIVLVPTNLLEDLSPEIDTIEEQLAGYLAEGYEGQMLRVPGSFYEHKRSKNLIKHKEFEDAEFEVVSITEGQGNWAGCAKSVEIRLPDGTTQSAGIRGSLQQQRVILKTASHYNTATVRYQNKTADGKLRFPVVVAIWDGERDL